MEERVLALTPIPKRDKESNFVTTLALKARRGN